MAEMKVSPFSGLGRRLAGKNNSSAMTPIAPARAMTWMVFFMRLKWGAGVGRSTNTKTTSNNGG